MAEHPPEEEQKKKLFLEAYDAYSEAIYRHCFFRVYSQSRAEELTQETFMKTWQYLASGGQTITNLKAFLYRVATNLTIDESRKKKEESLEERLAEGRMAEPLERHDQEMEKRVLVKEVMSVLDDLPEEARKIVIMRYVDDLDPGEIAEVLGVTPNAASVKLNRAIKSLKKILPE